MNQKSNEFDIGDIALAIDTDIQKLSVKNTPNLRVIHRKYSKMLKFATSDIVLELGRLLLKKYDYRGFAYGLIWYHKETLKKIGEAEVMEFGEGIDSWGAVDSFAGLIAGPVWYQGQINDQLIIQWADSKDRWWRRAALVSTVPLNRSSFGGKGDVPRTLKICRLLVKDRDDMVVKALSWALRELIRHDRNAVLEFLNQYKDVLASRVKREVMNKLTTGRKNPK